MRPSWRLILSLFCCMWNAKPLWAQMPFYTDNPDVTDRGTLRFEFFNDSTASNPLNSPTSANGKVNNGLPHNLELDFDTPNLSIYRAAGSKASSGIGDADMGVKWNFHKASRPLSFPALASSLYIEFPTGNSREELGSGLSDYWLNVIAQEPFTDKTRTTAHIGFLFAGNTSMS